MRVVDAKLGIVHGELSRSVGHSRTRWLERSGLLLVLRDEEGRIGLGEASPLPGYSPDSIEECWAALGLICDLTPNPFPEREGALCARASGASQLQKPFGEEQPRSGERSKPLPVPGRAAPASSGGRGRGLGLGHKLPPSAHFALETALLDLAAQRAQLPLHSLLSSTPRQRVQRCGLIDGDPSTWAEATRALLARNIRTIKLKVGRPTEREHLFALRDQVPGDWRLRLDANGAWSVDDARRRLAELAALCPEFVEQPVPPGALSELGPCAVPWAADESLRDPQERAQLVDSACSVFVLKPAILGGLRAAMEIAQARTAVPSHLFDGPVALAAYCELALALPESPLAAGVDSHDALAAWPSVDIPQLAQPGVIVPSMHPGLGFSPEAREEIASWIR